MRPRSSILHRALVLTGVNLLLRGVGMLFQAWLSGRIGAGGIGLLQLVLTAGGFAMTLGRSGVRTAVMYLCAEELGAKRPGGVRRAMTLCIGYALVCSTLAAALLFVLSGWLATAWIHNAAAAPPLRLLALGLPLGCFVSVLSGYFTVCGKLRKLVAAEICEQLLGVLLMVLLLHARGDSSAPGACCAIVAGSNLAALVPAVWLGASLWQTLRTAPTEPSRPMLRRLLHLTIPLGLSDNLRAGLRTLEQFLIPAGLAAYTASSGAGLDAYGTICGMVFPVLMFPAAILFALSELLVPELARCRAAKSHIRIRYLCRKTLRSELLFSFCVAALMYALAPQLGRMIYHSADAGRYLRLFSPLIPMLYTDAIVDGMCKGLGQQVACVRNNTITSVLDVALLYFLLPRLGIRGYFISFLITHAVNFYLSVLLLLGAGELASPEPILSVNAHRGLQLSAAGGTIEKTNRKRAHK